MGTLTDAVNTLVTNTTSLQTTVSGRITDMDGKIASADTAKIAAEAAKAGAEVAKSLADTAKTDAETAQTLAQSAKDAAETAQGIAATAKTDALLAKAATDTAKGNAVAAQSAAESARGNAEEWASKTSGAVSGGEMSAKYHAQTASTDAGTATTKAAAASTSEGNALASKNTATTKATESSNSASASATSASASSASASTASGHKDTANTKASTATTKASEASSSATSAAASASTATTKATAANTSANAAASSASTAASTLANKLDKTGDGSQLTGIETVTSAGIEPSVGTVGALWFDTVNELLNISNGTRWSPISLGPPGSEGNPISAGSDINTLTLSDQNNFFDIGGNVFEAYLTNSFAGGAGWWVRCKYSNQNWTWTPPAGAADADNHWNASNSATAGTVTWELPETSINSIRSISSQAWQKFTRGCNGSVDWGWSGNTGAATGNNYVQFKWYDGATNSASVPVGVAVNSNLAIGGGTAWSTSSTTRSPCEPNDGVWREEVYYFHASTSAGLADLPLRDYSNKDSGAGESSRIQGAGSEVWFKVA